MFHDHLEGGHIALNLTTDNLYQFLLFLHSFLSSLASSWICHGSGPHGYATPSEHLSFAVMVNVLLVGVHWEALAKSLGSSPRWK
eukprot:324834-Amphidinium_carterae.1